MKIKVCIGSSCHVKGSRQVLEQFHRMIAEKGLEGTVELGSSFCLGNCQSAVSITVDEEVCSVSPETAEEFFESRIMPMIAKS